MKCKTINALAVVFTSPPVWGRGLKCFLISVTNDMHNVAPCVGAWVEIIQGAAGAEGNVCRPLCGGVG